MSNQLGNISDNLNRLTSTAGGGKTISYYPNGNINVKSDVGTYQYGTAPHAVSSITLAPDSQAGTIDEIENTSYNRVSKLTLNSTTIKELHFTYNPDNQRNKMQYFEGVTPKKTTYYAGSYEKVVHNGSAIEEYDYIYTPEGLSAIVKQAGGTTTMYYVNTDYLGSIRTITKADKTVQTRYTYDAWGVQTTTFGTGITTRGYTGHEHIAEFGLINMNARMYDPVLGRFLEIDPYVANNTYSQDFNRYSYARNNPFRYTDPTGEHPLLIAAFIGGFINLAMNDHKADNFWQKLGYFAVGAAAGALSFGAGAGISSALAAGPSFIGGALVGGGAGFTSGFTTGLGNGLIQGQNFSDALWGGIQGGVMGGLTGGAIGGVAGGINSVVHGGNFWTGSGATFEQVAQVPSNSNSVTVGEGMEYSNKYAKDFSDAHFGKEIKGLNELYADRVPNGYQRVGDYVQNIKTGDYVDGIARYLGVGKGGTDVYLFKSAFTDPMKLYMTMGHEYVHIGINVYYGKNVIHNKSEAAAYPPDVIVAWPSYKPYARTCGTVAIIDDINYDLTKVDQDGTLTYGIKFSDYGLVYPVTINDVINKDNIPKFVELWEAMSDAGVTAGLGRFSC